MIDRNHPLPISQQAKVVGIIQGSVYYLPRPVLDVDLELMRQIGYKVGRKHVTTLMKRKDV